MSGSFGARLRTQRERRGVSLDTIAHSTKIAVGLFEALERDDTARWPSGIFRRAFIRAYATAIGLDPESTVKEFLERFPDPADQKPAGVGEGDRAGVPPSTSSATLNGPLRLTLADEPPRPMIARLEAMRSRLPRAAAAVCDFGIVIAVAVVAFAVAGMFWTPFTVATICYYFGGVLVVGTSPAACLLARVGSRAAPQPRLTALKPTTQAAAATHRVHHRKPFTRRYPKAV